MILRKRFGSKKWIEHRHKICVRETGRLGDTYSKSEFPDKIQGLEYFPLSAAGFGVCVCVCVCVCVRLSFFLSLCLRVIYS